MSPPRHHPLQLWAAVALTLLAALSSLGDFHLLSRTHPEVDDLFAAPPTGEAQRVADACAHDAATHVEAGATVLRQACPACTLRTPARVLPALPRLAARALPLARHATRPTRILDAPPRRAPSSRGPPLLA